MRRKKSQARNAVTFISYADAVEAAEFSLLGRASDTAVASDASDDIDSEWDMSSCSVDDYLTSAHARDGAEEFARAFGIHYEAHESLRLGDKERARDARRWELDPASSEDYLARTRGTRGRRPNPFVR